MKKVYLGNRVFTCKHGHLKMAHGPYSGHLRPIVRYLTGFTGHVYRFVHIPHELANFDHSMWMERNSRVTDRMHKCQINEGLGLDERIRTASVLPATVETLTVSDTASDVTLSYDSKGRLSFASFGDDGPSPRCTNQESRCRQPSRRDWIRSARLLF